MLKTVDLYYFSPTGGTKRAGEALASGIAEEIHRIDMSEKSIASPLSDVVVVAAPVFAGRIPDVVSEKITKLNGNTKKAVTAVVYGVRAYDDALLELNDLMKENGFEVIASAALVAQHSIVPEVGAGRPDEADISEISRFAKRILKALESDKAVNINVPGSRPYKEKKKGSTTPLSLSNCIGCGHCASVCPVDAVTVKEKGVVTDFDRCMMCMACVAACPVQARALPLQLQEALTEKLIIFKDIRRENEFFE